MVWNTLLSTFSEQFSSVDGADITLLILNSVMAILFSCIVFLAYRLTYTGTAFSKRFMISLGMMTLVTTIIMNVIANNVALSLGLVGSLSIIRFRTAVKDVRDATYIFWCIALGIACGVSLYLQALIGSLVILVFLLVCGQVKDEGKYLLVVRGKRESEGHVANVIGGYFGNRSVKLRSSSIFDDRIDIIYEISARGVSSAISSHKATISDLLLDIEGVEKVDLVQQTDDINR